MSIYTVPRANRITRRLCVKHWSGTRLVNPRVVNTLVNPRVVNTFATPDMEGGELERQPFATCVR
jgi:hypothetical protein